MRMNHNYALCGLIFCICLSNVTIQPGRANETHGLDGKRQSIAVKVTGDSKTDGEAALSDLTKSARDAYSSGDYQKVISITSEILSRAPGSEDGLVLRANANVELGNYDTAIADLKAQSFLKRSSIAFALGRAYQMKGLNKEALETYCVAFELDPTSAEAVSNRGLVYEDLNQYQFAKQDFSTAIELNPQFDFAWASRSECNFSMGLYDDCIADAKSAININPNNAFAYAQLACAYGQQRKIDEALKAAEKCVSLKTSDVFLRVLGVAQMDAGRVDEAIGTFSQSIDLAKNIDALEVRAICYCKRGEYGKAIDDYTDALKLKPGDGHFLGERALTYALAGNEIKSVEDAKAAVQALFKCAHSYSALVIEDAEKKMPAELRLDYLQRSSKASDGLLDGRLQILTAKLHKELGKNQESTAALNAAETLGFKTK